LIIPARIRDWMDETAADRTALLEQAGVDGPASVEVVAVGVATVELDRAEREYGGNWVSAPDDRLLGASARCVTTGTGGGTSPTLVLLEPNTEGRLAGALARHGEGPVALYLRVPPTGPSATSAHKGAHEGAHIGLRKGGGPLGPQLLVLGGPPAGPFLLLVGDPSPASADRVPSEP
jgi:hypothetical protein